MNGWNKSVSDRENTSKRNALGCFLAHSIADRGFDTLNALSSRNIFLPFILSSSSETTVLLSFHPSFYSYLLSSFVGSHSSPVFVYTTFYLHAKNSKQPENLSAQSGKTSCEFALSYPLTCRLLIR